MKKYILIVNLVFSFLGSNSNADSACASVFINSPAKVGNFHLHSENALKYSVARPGWDKNQRETLFTSDGQFMFVRGGGTENMFAHLESISSEQVVFKQRSKRFIIKSDNSVTIELFNSNTGEVWNRTTYFGLKAEDIDE